MFDYLTKTQVVNVKEIIAESIKYQVWEMGCDFEIAFTDGGELNFDKSFLRFNVKKKLYPKATLNVTVNIEYQTLLA